MDETYELTTGGVIRGSDGAYIPEDNSNSDWRQYQAWLRDGGVPGETILDQIEVVEQELEDKRALAAVARQAIRDAVDNPPNNIADIRTMIFNIARALGIINGN